MRLFDWGDGLFVFFFKAIGILSCCVLCSVPNSLCGNHLVSHSPPLSQLYTHSSAHQPPEGDEAEGKGGAGTHEGGGDTPVGELLEAPRWRGLASREPIGQW